MKVVEDFNQFLPVPSHFMCLHTGTPYTNKVMKDFGHLEEKKKKTDSELYIVVMGSTRIYGITQTVFHKIYWFAYIACKPQISAPH